MYLHYQTTNTPAWIARTSDDTNNPIAVDGLANIGLDANRFDTLDDYREQLVSALLAGKFTPQANTLMLDWTKETIPVFVHRTHSLSPVYYVVTRRIDSDAYQCLRFFFIGEKLHVSADFDDVPLMKCLEWLSEDVR